MEFQRERVFTALNADELKPGDKVLTSNNIASLKEAVRLDVKPSVIVAIWGEMYGKRFKCKSTDTEYDAEYAYLVERKENCTNCSGHCEVTAYPELDGCENWKPKTEQKNCYNCRLTYTRDGVMRCMMNDGRCSNAEIACNHYEPKTEKNCTNCSHSCKSINPCLRYEPKTEPRAEKKYRPFANTDELIKVWCEYKCPAHNHRERGLTMPLIWVRGKISKNTNTGWLVTGIGYDGVALGDTSLSWEELFEDWVFLDGSPCGVEE